METPPLPRPSVETWGGSDAQSLYLGSLLCSSRRVGSLSAVFCPWTFRLVETPPWRTLGNLGGQGMSGSGPGVGASWSCDCLEGENGSGTVSHDRTLPLCGTSTSAWGFPFRKCPQVPARKGRDVWWPSEPALMASQPRVRPHPAGWYPATQQNQ